MVVQCDVVHAAEHIQYDAEQRTVYDAHDVCNVTPHYDLHAVERVTECRSRI